MQSRSGSTAEVSPTGGRVAHVRGGLARQLEHVAEHVGETLFAIEALEHPQSAAEFDLLREQCRIRGLRARVGEAVVELLGELPEREVLLLDTAPAPVEDVIGGDSVCHSMRNAKR